MDSRDLPPEVREDLRVLIRTEKPKDAGFTDAKEWDALRARIAYRVGEALTALAIKSERENLEAFLKTR